MTCKKSETAPEYIKMPKDLNKGKNCGEIQYNKLNADEIDIPCLHISL